MNDITGDGIDEVIIATQNYWILCLNGASSGTADTLWSFNTYISSYSAGSIGPSWEYGVQDAMAIASDLNGDGFSDVVIGTGGGNEHVYALNGSNGELIWEFGTNDPGSTGLGDFGAVDVRRDFNNDGIPDVLAIADGNISGTGYKSAYLFNGPDGAIIWQYAYPGPNPSFGKTIISIDDVSGDNLPDAIIAVGNNGATNLKTYCLNGQTGLPLWDHDALNHEPKELLEFPIPGETPDVIVAEYFSTIQRLDGQTGNPVWTVNFGGLSGMIQINRISDVNNDAVDDVLVASFTSGATCLSGADGNYVWTYPTEFQFAIAPVPDLTGDGIEEVLFGTGNSSPTYGNFFCISGKGDSVLFNHYFPADKVYTVHGFGSIDGNNSFELLSGTREGKVLCYSGGLGVVTGVANLDMLLPQEFRLLQNYPNPFNPSTTIHFELPRQADIEILIFDILGRRIRSFLLKNLNPGTHQVIWDGKNEYGSVVTSGLYIYQVRMGPQSISRQMLLLK
jgi:outer membrane protein assembly factor BamB